MSDTHDYPTRLVLGKDLGPSHVLVGESGGLSAVYSSVESVMGGIAVATEHGMLYLNANDEYPVYDEGA